MQSNAPSMPPSRTASSSGDSKRQDWSSRRQAPLWRRIRQPGSTTTDGSTYADEIIEPNGCGALLQMAQEADSSLTVSVTARILPWLNGGLVSPAGCPLSFARLHVGPAARWPGPSCEASCLTDNATGSIHALTRNTTSTLEAKQLMQSKLYSCRAGGSKSSQHIYALV